jgi:hypothetical protein
MFIKRIAIVSAAALGLLSIGYAASANPIFSGQAAKADSKSTRPFLKVSGDWDSGYSRKHYRHRMAKSQDWDRGYWHRHRDSGPPYSACYMKCIYLSHPADFCQNVAHIHFCY